MLFCSSLGSVLCSEVLLIIIVIIIRFKIFNQFIIHSAEISLCMVTTACLH